MMADADMPHMWDSREPRMRVMTRTLIRRHRDKIERVAVALLERGRLTAEELDAICADPL